MKALLAAVLKSFYSIHQVPSITYISEYSRTIQIIILLYSEMLYNIIVEL